MQDAPDRAVLRYLRRIDAHVDGLRQDMREVNTRLGLLEQRYAVTSSRIDRVETRLDRIEKRLDLVEV